jgi:hypothetical protein
MVEVPQSLDYPAGSAQLLRALYDYSVQYPSSFIAYDYLANAGEVAPGFLWVRRFVDDMTEHEYIEVAQSVDQPEGAWGMRILPIGKAYVEQEQAANPDWGRKPVDAAASSGMNDGSCPPSAPMAQI